MWYDPRHRSFRSVLRSLLLNATVVLALSIPVFCQGMSYNTTVYTDYSYSGTGTIHAWGYTYAPSGTYIIHNYKAKTKITLPGGSSTENTATGSGYSPAIANVYMNIDDNLVGDIDIVTVHDAFCPQVYSGTVAFITTSTSATVRKGVSVTCYIISTYSAHTGECVYVPISNCNVRCVDAASFWAAAPGNCPQYLKVRKKWTEQTNCGCTSLQCFFWDKTAETCQQCYELSGL